MQIIVCLLLIIGVCCEIKLWFKLKLLMSKKKIEKEDKENDYVEM